MLAIRIEYLTGRCVATAYNDRTVPEWPPHPARLFSALVNAWVDADESAAGQAALEWLERADPPAICASEASYRTVMTNFVPVNDSTVLKAVATAAAKRSHKSLDVERLEGQGVDEKQLSRARKQLAKAEQSYLDTVGQAIQPGKVSEDGLKTAPTLLPQGRVRQARTFPSATPDEPVVHMIWRDAPSDAVRQALGELLLTVHRLGHSSSLVGCSFASAPPEPTWVPDGGGDLTLRVPGDGQLVRLQEAWELHQGVEPRTLPCRFQRYGHPVPARADHPQPVFSDRWIVLRRVGGPRLPSQRAVAVATALRGALLSFAIDPPPEVLSGHQLSGKPSEKPHMAIVPLPFVAHRHAHGGILGVAIVLPRELSNADRTAVLQAIGRLEETHREEDEDLPSVPLQMGRAGVLELERIATGPAGQATLRASSWCRPSRRWATVTPIALDRNPGQLGDLDPEKSARAYGEAEATIARACERISLPNPSHVTVVPSVVLPGTTKARNYPVFPADRKRTQRVLVHARIEFDELIEGPVLIGAGRYFGLGFCRPVSDREEDR